MFRNMLPSANQKSMEMEAVAHALARAWVDIGVSAGSRVTCSVALAAVGWGGRVSTGPS